MKHLFLALLSATSIMCLSTGASVAQKPVSIPTGGLVRYGGVECGQIKGVWLSGTITPKGQFISSQATLATLKKDLKKASKGKKAGITKKITALTRKIQQQSPICEQLSTGAIAPRTSQSPAAGATPITWSFNLKDLTDSDIGSVRTYFCPANGGTDTIYGSDTYTADSPICVAAVHAGLITFQFGGNVTVKVKNGLDYYIAGIRNGVTSNLYNAWGLSYSFINPATNAEYASSAPVILPWNTSLSLYGSRTGLSLTVLCPANGTPGTIWGTDVYTHDSSVCTAAVHAGKTTKLKGGAVTVVMSTGRTSYAGSTRRGITSSSYGNWPASILFQ